MKRSALVLLLALTLALAISPRVTLAATVMDFTGYATCSGLLGGTCAGAVDTDGGTFAQLNSGGYVDVDLTRGVGGNISASELRVYIPQGQQAQITLYDSARTVFYNQTLTAGVGNLVKVVPSQPLRYLRATRAGGSTSVYQVEMDRPPVPPAAPAGLTATPGDGQAALSWSSPATGDPPDGYKVYRNGTEIAMITATTYTATGLTNGISYMFTVRAYNLGGTSPDSNTATVTPVDPLPAPGAPTGLTATAGDGQVSLSWSAPSTGGPPDGYKVYRNGTELATATGTTYTATGLTNGISYTFAVRAYNGSGTSADSNTVTATPAAAPVPPGVPAGLTATAYDGQVVLTWSAPTTGSTPDGYRVYRDGVQVTTTTTRHYSDTGVVNGTTYTYTVRAYNAAGASADSTTATATPNVGAGSGPVAWSMDLAGLGVAIQNGITSLSGVWVLAAGLGIAAGVLTWGLDMIRRWRSGGD